jgi:hypothetical protein
MGEAMYPRQAVALLVEALRYKPEVASLIPGGVNGIFHWDNPSGHSIPSDRRSF